MKGYTVSFIIPALNEEEHIGNALESIRKFTPPNISYEIVVADHGSTDKTPLIAEQIDVAVQHFKGGTVGSLRNRAVKCTSGVVLVFLDADITITKEWGANIDSVIESITERNAVIGSRCLPPDQEHWLQKYWFQLLSAEKASGYIGTGHMIVSRLLFEKLGGFDPALITGEDYDFCKRAREINASIELMPKLLVYHHDFPTSLRAFILRESWHGIGDCQQISKFIGSKIALTAACFAFLHLLAFLAIFWQPIVVIPILVILISLLTLISVVKFPGLKITYRLVTIGILYFYFTGRVFAFYRAWQLR
jgi:glycosyltransferase involved in cell wall biosynthesis